MPIHEWISKILSADRVAKMFESLNQNKKEKRNQLRGSSGNGIKCFQCGRKDHHKAERRKKVRIKLFDSKGKIRWFKWQLKVEIECW